MAFPDLRRRFSCNSFQCTGLFASVWRCTLPELHRTAHDTPARWAYSSIRCSDAFVPGLHFQQYRCGDKELAYYAEAKLQDREVEVLTEMERIQRRNELDRQRLEQMKKAAEESGSQQ